MLIWLISIKKGVGGCVHYILKSIPTVHALLRFSGISGFWSILPLSFSVTPLTLVKLLPMKQRNFQPWKCATISRHNNLLIGKYANNNEYNKSVRTVPFLHLVSNYRYIHMAYVLTVLSYLPVCV